MAQAIAHHYSVQSKTVALISAIAMFCILSRPSTHQSAQAQLEIPSETIGENELEIPPETGREAELDTRFDTQLDSPQGISPQDIVTVATQLEDLRQLPLFLPRDRGRLITTDQQLSPISPSQPSLFRIQDLLTRRYRATGIVEQWQVYQLPNGLSYIDIVVDESIWRQLNYFRRYAFVSQVGRDAQQEGYHVRIFHSGDAENRRESIAPGGSTRLRRSSRSALLRGTHFCDFRSADTTTDRCRVFVRQ